MDTQGVDAQNVDATANDNFKAPPVIRSITLDDLRDSIRSGLSDFRTEPQYGLFFGAIYMLGGWLIMVSLLSLGLPFVAFPAAAGFALVAPFIAAGIYEVSHRLETGAPLNWDVVLGALRHVAGRDMGWMALVTTFAFYIWVDTAGIVYLLFFGLNLIEPMAFIETVFTTAAGWSFLALGHFAGAIIATIVFSITVVSFPLLVDRDIDFVTAMVTSVKAVVRNPVPMLCWAALISAAMIASFATLLIGFLVTLPIAGHVTWHLYRKVIAPVTA